MYCWTSSKFQLLVSFSKEYKWPDSWAEYLVQNNKQNAQKWFSVYLMLSRSPDLFESLYGVKKIQTNIEKHSIPFQFPALCALNNTFPTIITFAYFLFEIHRAEKQGRVHSLNGTKLYNFMKICNVLALLIKIFGHCCFKRPRHQLFCYFHTT